MYYVFTEMIWFEVTEAGVAQSLRFSFRLRQKLKVLCLAHA